MNSVCKSLLLLLALTPRLCAQKDVSADTGKQPGVNQRGTQAGHAVRSPAEKGFIARYDKNGDQVVSFAEFGSVGRAASLDEPGRRRLFNHLDKNGDGKIMRGEVPRPAPPLDRGHDLNGDGKISLDEFRRNPRVKGLSPDRIKTMFSRMDRNGDKVLTPVDFPRRSIMPLKPNELQRLDSNEDGGVSFEEWRIADRHQDVPLEELGKRFRKLDRNRNGLIEGADRDRSREEVPKEPRRP